MKVSAIRRFIAAGVAALLLAGCGQKNAAVNTFAEFTAENEIFTYEKVDPEKVPLVVARTGNIELGPLCAAFESENPDIQVILLDITGGTSRVKPAADWVRNDCAPDVFVTASGFFTDDDVKKYFENLSATDYISNYEAEALRRSSIDGNIYLLPGPSSVNCMQYNKTLFDKYGWQVPATFDEFVALCNRITADTGGEVEPWNPNAKYSNEFTLATEAFVYEELFGGAANRTWYDNFTGDTATFEGHMEPYYAAMQTLIDNGILLPEHFTFSATTRGINFSSGKIAMINTSATKMSGGEYEYGLMPFPTTKGALGYLCDTYSCFVGVPVKERTAPRKDAINRFLSFFSNPAGQEAYIADALRVSNVKGVVLREDAGLAALQPAIEAGHLFAIMDFANSQGMGKVNLWQDVHDMAAGVLTAQECIARTDAAVYEAKAAVEPVVVATASENMTVLETSFYIADAYREKAGADIGLIANNTAFRGNLMRIFAGNITADFLQVLKPRSFENGSTLVKCTMTGADLLAALNAPPDYVGVADCVYAFSGLRCEIAPWREAGQRYVSVTLADGAPLDPEGVYTVACWGGTISPDFITGAPVAVEGSFEDIMTGKMSAEGTVAPANDGRCTLLWS